MTTATVTRQSAHKWTVAWMGRPDFVVVQPILGNDLDAAISAATAVLASNGLSVFSIQPHPNGNATLEVSS